MRCMQMKNKSERMIHSVCEYLLVLLMMISALIHGEALYYVAAAGFAIAGQISRLVDRMDGAKHG